MRVDLPAQLRRQEAELEELDRTDDTQPPTPEESAEEPSPPAPEPESEDWKARFLTIQGKYNAEVPRLHNQVRELIGQVSALEAKLQEVAKPQPTPSPEPPKANVTAKDVETFGGDLVDLIRRAADEEMSRQNAAWSKKLEELATENATLKGQLENVAQRQHHNARQAYIAELTKLIPDWEKQNVDPGFLAWLAEADPISGVTRQVHLNEAFEANDVRRTAVLFNAYRQSIPAQPADAPKPEVTRQTAPSRAKSPTAPPPAAPGNARIFTSGEIEKFFKDVIRGVYAGREADAQRMEAEIDLAVAQGRVRD